MVFPSCCNAGLSLGLAMACRACLRVTPVPSLSGLGRPVVLDSQGAMGAGRAIVVWAGPQILLGWRGCLLLASQATPATFVLAQHMLAPCSLAWGAAHWLVQGVWWCVHNLSQRVGAADSKFRLRLAASGGSQFGVCLWVFTVVGCASFSLGDDCKL